MSKILDFINENGGKDFKCWINYSLMGKDGSWRPARLAIKKMEASFKEYDPFRGTDYKVILQVARTKEEVADFKRNCRLIEVAMGNCPEISEEDVYWRELEMYTDSFMGYVANKYLIPCKNYEDYEVVERKGAEYLTPYQTIEHIWEELVETNKKAVSGQASANPSTPLI